MKLMGILLAIMLFLSSIPLFSQPVGPHEGHHKMCQRHFQMMDKNKDGKISKEEWKEFHDKMFSNMDMNNDGFVELEEMEKHHKGRMPMDE